MKKIFMSAIAVMLAVIMVFGGAPLGALAGFELSESSGIESAASYNGVYEYDITDEGTARICSVDKTVEGIVIIPSTLGGCPIAEIGEFSFGGCDNMTGVVIPDTVKYIGLSAFSNCINLQSVVIPASVESVETSAFSGCTQLDSITLSEATGLGFNVFKDTAYYNNPANWEDGVLYLSKHLIKADKNEVYGVYQVKDGTVELSCGAFEDCDGLTGINIPDSVSRIESPFRGCINLSQITLPATAIRLYSDNFFDTALYNDSTNWEDGVLYIGKHLIKANKTILSSIYFIKDGTLTIAGGAFYDCEGLTGVTVPSSVEIIGQDAFDGCESLTGISIPDSVKYIGNNAFANCDSLAGITVGEGNMHYTSDSYGALFDKDKTELIRFPAANGATSYSIPDTVKRVGNGAFSECSSLVDLTLPDSLVIIGDSAFRYCVNLTSVTIPASVKSIRGAAFGQCTNLADINLPDTVRYINGVAFSETAYSNNDANWENGLLYLGHHLVEVDQEKISGNVKIKAGTLTIAGYTFNAYETLTSVMIPASVRFIGVCTFENCGSLTNIYYAASEADWRAVETGGYNGFADMTINYDSNVVIINSDNITVKYRETATLSAEMSAEGYYIEWSSSKPRVATVDSNGNVTTKGFGMTVITAKVVDENGNPVKDSDSKEITDSCNVTVKLAWWQWLIKILLFGWIWY